MKVDNPPSSGCYKDMEELMRKKGPEKKTEKTREGWRDITSSVPIHHKEEAVRDRGWRMRGR
jgi:hypothetical protein